MKRITILINIAIIALLSFNTQAQIKVSIGGQVKIFGDRPQDDPFNDLSMQVYGSIGEYLAGGKLGIGDYGRNENWGANVYIGELGNTDTDKLVLHGKKGIYLTWGQGYPTGGIIARWEDSDPTKFKFETDVYAKGILLSSDKRFKENIKPISKKLSELQKLNGVSYVLSQSSQNDVLTPRGALTEKEQNDIAHSKEVNKKRKEKKRTRLGLIAQNVQAVFPELVEEDSEGYLSIDYIGLIPVLVESIKEQQKQIELLEKMAKKDGYIKN